MKIFRIATRKSPLAQWQTDKVISLFSEKRPDLKFEKVLIVTEGDRILDKPLSMIGGKGLFLKELEEAMLQGKADMAVHSLKDVPVKPAEGFVIAADLERDSPLDAFVSVKYETLAELPAGAVVGSSSLRRCYQLGRIRPDLVFRDLRGNINTRLSKLDEGQYDAIILASVGLKRLGLDERIRNLISPDDCVPAAAQGVVCVEALESNEEVRSIISLINNPASQRIANAERIFLEAVEGDCRTPAGCYISKEDSDSTKYTVRCMLGKIDSVVFETRKTSAVSAELENTVAKIAKEMKLSLNE